MKKFLIILTLGLLCFGCGKNEKNVTINIYQNGDTNKVEEKESTSKSEEKTVKNNDAISSYEDSNVGEKLNDNTNKQLENTTSTFDSIKQKTKEKYDSAKSWYGENKDELKEINREILQEDIDTITNVVDKANTWYSDNKDSIKETAKEKYNEGKDTIKDLFNKVKNNE